VGVEPEHHVDRRCPEETVVLGILSRPAQHFRSGGGQANKVGRGRARDETDRRFAGRCIRSSSQCAAIVSTAAAVGAATWLVAFWPQAAASQSKATPTGCEAPITQPKNRGSVTGCNPGALRETNSSMTANGSVLNSGAGRSRLAKISP
jgi:hypothetical protein